MATNTEVFGSLYDYSSSKGIVLPQTSDIRETIANGFKEIFGQDISTDSTTPIGRFIEALTLLFINVLGVNAQNANFLNPEQAVGKALDNLGAIFGIKRDSMNDFDYRAVIMSAGSRGVGFAESIRRAVASVAGVTTASVINNGEADPAVLPNEEAGMLVAPHSVAICVAGGDDDEIAKAIDKTISAGCGMVQTGFLDENTVTKTIVDASSATESAITFYRPSKVYARFSVSIRNVSYTGTDASADADLIVRDYVSEHNSSHSITAADVITAIGVAGIGIVCTAAAIETKNVAGEWIATDKLIVRPNEYVDVDDSSMTVSVTLV